MSAFMLRILFNILVRFSGIFNPFTFNEIILSEAFLVEELGTAIVPEDLFNLMRGRPPEGSKRRQLG